ncbi:MAG: hypothetical protein EXS10_06830 [Phycisphaerales bacterium]|nr:hypothetical protein [Phycisphaerales bacterium]
MTTDGFDPLDFRTPARAPTRSIHASGATPDAEPDAELLEALTDAQRAAVLHLEGPALVLAGPGSGKTRVITRRIAYLVSRGVKPWQILALTFTNKAAGEMRNRVERLLPRGLSSGLVVSTFHSYCASLLRRHGDRIGLQAGFSIYDSDDQKSTMKAAIEAAGLTTSNWTPASVLAAISELKNRLLTPEEYLLEADDFWTRSVAKAYVQYQALLHRSNACDFDDLLMKSARLLRDDAEVRARMQDRARFILLDEYQDTNHAQFVIAATLASEHRNLLVVGDPDQSIYGWRGADISNILDFEEHFAGAVVLPLGENFRSTAAIVRAADGLIRHNTKRPHKDLHTALEEGEKVRVVRCQDEHDEADQVAAFFEERLREGVPYKSMAVLYRMNALSRVLEDALRRRMIPSIVVRGTAFYDRKEIKDAIAYFRVLANPRDEVSLRRIVNVPTRGIGPTTVRKIEAYAAGSGYGIFEALAIAPGAGIVKGKIGEAVHAFADLLRGFQRSMDERLPGDLADFVGEVLKQTKLDEFVGRGGDDEAERVANLDELVSAAREFQMIDDPDVTHPSLRTAVFAWLESVALVADADAFDPDRGSVTLMTLHAAKGLEFDTVCVVGLEHGLLPHARSVESDDALEEERRLLFVGMTRAERALMVSSAVSRQVRGVRQATIESAFLKEIPADATRKSDRSPTFDRIVYDEPEAFSDLDPSELFPIGCSVKHPIFGIGKVEFLARGFGGTRARIAFRSVGTKTVIVEHAKLSRVQ